jgi:hypothetical protein
MTKATDAQKAPAESENTTTPESTEPPADAVAPNTTTAVIPAPTGTMNLGSQDVDASNLILPRVKITQAMSGERTNGLSEAGSFFNTLTNESYGSSLRFIPVHPFMNRVLLVRDQRRTDAENLLGVPFSEGDGLKCKSLDMVHGVGEPGIACAECPLSQWREGRQPPICSEVYNLGALTEDGDFIILQFQRSSAKAGKQLFSMLRFAGPTALPWSHFYSAATHEETIKGKGTFAVPVVTKTRDLAPPELGSVAQWWHRQLAGIGPIDVTPTDDDEPDGGAAAYRDAPVDTDAADAPF